MEIYIAILIVIVFLIAWIGELLAKAEEKDILSHDVLHPKKDDKDYPTPIV